MTRRPPRSDWPDIYPSGRNCVEHGCITVLNHFNPGPYCLLHAQRHEAKVIEAQRVRCINGKPHKLQAVA